MCINAQKTNRSYTSVFISFYQSHLKEHNIKTSVFKNQPTQNDSKWILIKPAKKVKLYTFFAILKSRQTRVYVIPAIHNITDARSDKKINKV